MNIVQKLLNIKIRTIAACCLYEKAMSRKLFDRHFEMIFESRVINYKFQ